LLKDLISRIIKKIQYSTMELSLFKVAFTQNFIAWYAEKSRSKNTYFEVFCRWNPNSFQFVSVMFVSVRFSSFQFVFSYPNSFQLCLESFV